MDEDYLGIIKMCFTACCEYIQLDFVAIDYIQNIIIPLVNNTKDSVMFEANHYRKDDSKYRTQTIVRYFSMGSLKLLVASMISIE